MAEESLALYALVITVLIAAGNDALVGVAVGVLLGCGIGALSSTLNPFATGIALRFAGIPIPQLAINLGGSGLVRPGDAPPAAAPGRGSAQGAVPASR